MRVLMVILELSTLRTSPNAKKCNVNLRIVQPRQVFKFKYFSLIIENNFTFYLYIY